MSSGSDHKREKWEGAKAFCAASVFLKLLLSCTVSTAQDNIVMPSYNLCAECRVRGMGLTTPKQILSATILPPRQSSGAPLQPISHFLCATGTAQKGWSQDPRNCPRADTHEQLTQLYNYLALLKPSETPSAGRSSSCSEWNAFVLGGMEGKNIPSGKGSKKTAIELVL